MSEYHLPTEATGPFVLSGYSGYKQVQFPRGRLFAFDSEGNYMLTCSSTGGVIFKVSLRSGGEYSHASIQALVTRLHHQQLEVLEQDLPIPAL